jgi:hypothetical protein
LIDVGGWRGLEIGPLHSPRVRKDQGDVDYLDHATTEELRVKYSANEQTRPHLDELVEVDFVADGRRRLAEVTATDAPFDYVIASHLLEHLPDPVGWLQQVAEILVDGGVLSLVIPDKRFSFDTNRTPTEISEWVDAYLRGLTTPSFRQLYDFLAKVTTIDGSVDTAGLWSGTADYAGVVRDDVPDPDAAAFEVCVEHRNAGGFIDVHCGVYTPASFLRLYDALVRLGLCSFTIASFTPTAVDTLEFFVTLAKLPDGLDEADRRARQLASIPDLHGPEPAVPNPPTHGDLDAVHMSVSVREERLIRLKRHVIESIRQRIPPTGHDRPWRSRGAATRAGA